MKRRIIAGGAIAVVVIAGIWLALAWAGRRGRSDYSGTVETREIQIGSKVGGRVTEVPVEEGQTVKAGTTLVRFECDELKAQRTQAEAALAQAQADLETDGARQSAGGDRAGGGDGEGREAAYERARNGPRKQEIEQAQADFAAATADATNAEVFFKRMEKLVATDTISRQQFDDARDKRDAAAQRAE